MIDPFFDNVLAADSNGEFGFSSYKYNKKINLKFRAIFKADHDRFIIKESIGLPVKAHWPFGCGQAVLGQHHE